MGDVIHMRFSQASGRPERRQIEVRELRRLIENRKTDFRSGESVRVAQRLVDRIENSAKSQGRTQRSVCQELWPREDNPGKRLPELLVVKKARKLLEYAERIAKVVGDQADDLLLEAFRDTRFDEQVNALLSGKAVPHDFDECWQVLSDTIHALTTEVSRAEQLEEHQLLGASVAGNYDPADGTIRPSSHSIVRGPLANWSTWNGEYPLLPSVVLFQSPLTEGVACTLEAAAIGYSVQVEAKVLREVRLAIGPADSGVPRPLFEFRSVFTLDGPDGPIPIFRPWHDLEARDLIVQIDGSWQEATIDLPEGFSADSEPEVQYVHHDFAWRPVTTATCRDVLSRNDGYEIVPWPAAASFVPVCPPRSIGSAIEAALFADAEHGLISELRRDAARVTGLLREWIAQQRGHAIAAHEELRASWRTWS